MERPESPSELRNVSAAISSQYSTKQKKHTLQFLLRVITITVK